jgi:hypothetical protein
MHGDAVQALMEDIKLGRGVVLDDSILFRAYVVLDTFQRAREAFRKCSIGHEPSCKTNYDSLFGCNCAHRDLSNLLGVDPIGTEP